MPENVIATRIADFLKRFPPFDELSEKELQPLCEVAIVKYASKGEYFFKEDDSSMPYLFVVKEGNVLLEKNSAGVKKLIDICDEGDLFGVRSMLSGKPYVFDAICAEETIAYGIPVNQFRGYLEKKPKIAYFFAAGLAGGQTDLQHEGQEKISPYQATGSLLNWNKPLEKPKRTLITGSPNDTIKEVALLMTKEKIGAIILVDEKGKGVGITTETDFKTKVATGKVGINEAISKIMTAELVTMPLGKPLTNYLIKMLRHKINHLCLIKNNRPIGILSHHDLTGAHQNHPISLAFAMEEATDLSELKTLRNDADDLIKFYLEQHVSIKLVSSLAAHINDTLITKIIEFSLNTISSTMGPPPCQFAWVSLGSEGRSEQLIRTDQDNALIYEDTDGDNQPYFLALSRLINENLAACGFELCPANMMAGNEKWCQPLSKWKSYFAGWIQKPEEMSLMLSTIFFDYRLIYGEHTIIKKLDNYLKEAIKKDKIFINYLAKNSLKNPPPLSFFRNFMVERSGEHEDQFDIKARAMMPLVDIARVLALDSGEVVDSNTFRRYKLMAKLDPNNAALYMSAAESYEYLMRFRALNGFRNNNSGRFVPIAALSKIERQILRNTFDPIRRLQEMLEVRYQLSYFN